MKYIYKEAMFVLSVITLLMLNGCEKILMENDPANNPQSNFESLWNTANEKYSFFEYKGIDWDDIYSNYSQQINEDMTDTELFDVLGAMLNELKDGHVNLITPFDISRYPFVSNVPENFDWRLIKDYYIGWDYRVTGGLAHTVIERGGEEIGYIRYSSFMNGISQADLQYVLESLKDTRGLILDLRSNGGGAVNNIYILGEFLADKERTVYSIKVKTGPEHNNFGNRREVKMKPDTSANYLQSVAVLTNRGCYSATSIFCTAMKSFPNVIQIGDTTGGGLGAPAGFELPNGWAYRFSISQTIAPGGENWENGVPPDISVWMDPANEINGVDDIMEAAIDYLLNN